MSFRNTLLHHKYNQVLREYFIDSEKILESHIKETVLNDEYYDEWKLNDFVDSLDLEVKAKKAFSELGYYHKVMRILTEKDFPFQYQYHFIGR